MCFQCSMRGHRRLLAVFDPLIWACSFASDHHHHLAVFLVGLDIGRLAMYTVPGE